MKKFLSFLLVLFFASCSHMSPLPSHSPSINHSELYSSVGKIGIYTSVGEERILINSGTGFSVGEHSILTAEHLCSYIDSGKSIYLSFLNKGKEVILDEKLIPIKRNKSYDLCLLSIVDNPLKPILFSKKKPEMGDKVFALSVSKGVAYLVTEGYYGNEIKTNIDGIETTVAVITVSSAPGSSGAPLLNEDGEFVGILKAVYLPIYFMSCGSTYDNIKKFLEK